MREEEFRRDEVFRRLTTCPIIHTLRKGYPRPYCIRHLICEKGCCARCEEKDCRRFS